MIRWLFAAILLGLVCALLFGHQANAQLVVNGQVNGACADTPRDPPLPVPAKTIPTQADMPRQLGGTGTAAVLDVNAKGIAAGWWVPRTGAPSLYLYAVTWAYVWDHPGLMGRLLLLGAAPGGTAGTAAAIGASYEPTLHILDMCDVWNPIVAGLNTSKPTPPPVGEVWKATGGTIFTFAGGRLTGVTPRRSVAGDVCNCTTRAVVGATTYCPTTVPTEATACKP